MVFRSLLNWLHLQWPANRVERLPVVGKNGTTRVSGLYLVGDLVGVPLLKFSSDTGAKAARSVAEDLKGQATEDSEDLVDLAIVGAGVAGIAAAAEAKQLGLSFSLIDSSGAFSTIVNFPKGKPIYTYPSEMTPTGQLQFSAAAKTKESLLEELRAFAQTHDLKPIQAHCAAVKKRGAVFELELSDESGAAKDIKARRVIIAIGRSGNFRKLDVPGEDREKVQNRLHDPSDYRGQKVLVVGAGDSACEAAIALSQAGAETTLSYRAESLSRPKAENQDQVAALLESGSLQVLASSNLKSIEEDRVHLRQASEDLELKNDQVFTLIGREAPLDFLRRCGVGIQGETSLMQKCFLAMFLLAIVFIYDWKNHGFITENMSAFQGKDNFPSRLVGWVSSWGESWQERVADRSTVLGTIAVSMKSRSFYYTLGYTLLIGIFGVLRIRRRKTPYVKWQTLSLFFIQALPLFVLPEILLPYMGYNGAFDSGIMKSGADAFFESYISAEELAAHQWPDWGHPRAYWRAYGFILAWPLMVYNIFTSEPIWAWVILGFLQTFVAIPLLVWRYGKGAYCGWICSCGGLAETMGDTQRTKMFHGPISNRFNFIGQVFLLTAFVFLGLRVFGWVFPDGYIAQNFDTWLTGKNAAGLLTEPLSYNWFIDIFFGGVIGVGFYFKFSGRVWCRFACPLAALMHIYARFTSFRIFADKKKCISCQVCTSVCHQGIDVMSFANKGEPMADPQCVRCSACVQSCPTGTLEFGRIDTKTGAELSRDAAWLSASEVIAAEKENTD